MFSTLTHHSPGHTLSHQCHPLDVDNPRITEDTMNVAYSLILLFDEIENSTPG